MKKKEIYVTRSSMPPFEEYIEMIRPLWESRRLTNMGKYHRELEEKLQSYLEADCVSLMSNGHMSLELAIQAMGFPKGSEVITTPYTFVSTTHAIIRNGLDPVFCDIKDDYTIDEERIEDLVTEKTAAIIPVHTYGNICNVGKIEEIADKYGLKVIYDAAHAFGETYRGKGIACYGDVSVFSFHATKVFHTLEGGAVCCREKSIYEKLYNLKNFGIRSEELVVSIGANAKMNEFQAAMGLCNLKHMNGEIQKRKMAADCYTRHFEGVDGITLRTIQADVRSNYGYFPVLFADRRMRDRVYTVLADEGIHARKYFYPITADQACFKNKYRGLDLKKARNLSDRVLVLPLYAGIGEEEIQWVADTVKAVL